MKFNDYLKGLNYEELKHVFNGKNTLNQEQKALLDDAILRHEDVELLVAVNIYSREYDFSKQQLILSRIKSRNFGFDDYIDLLKYLIGKFRFNYLGRIERGANGRLWHRMLTACVNACNGAINFYSLLEILSDENFSIQENFCNYYIADLYVKNIETFNEANLNVGLFKNFPILLERLAKKISVIADNLAEDDDNRLKLIKKINTINNILKKNRKYNPARHRRILLDEFSDQFRSETCENSDISTETLQKIEYLVNEAEDFESCRAICDGFSVQYTHFGYYIYNKLLGYADDNVRLLIACNDVLLSEVMCDGMKPDIMDKLMASSFSRQDAINFAVNVKNRIDNDLMSIIMPIIVSDGLTEDVYEIVGRAEIEAQDQIVRYILKEDLQIGNSTKQDTLRRFEKKVEFHSSLHDYIIEEVYKSAENLDDYLFLISIATNNKKMLLKSLDRTYLYIVEENDKSQEIIDKIVYLFINFEIDEQFIELDRLCDDRSLGEVVKKINEFVEKISLFYDNNFFGSLLAMMVKDLSEGKKLSCINARAFMKSSLRMMSSRNQLNEGRLLSFDEAVQLLELLYSRKIELDVEDWFSGSILEILISYITDTNEFLRVARLASNYPRDKKEIKEQLTMLFEYYNSKINLNDVDIDTCLLLLDSDLPDSIRSSITNRVSVLEPSKDQWDKIFKVYSK